jgi:myosin heavy subunit
MGGGDGSGGGAEAHVRAKHPVETKIIQQNPILEAFGNAKTVMNDNSSRFGKFIDLRFGPQGTVTGADMSHYLLEKARIVMQGARAYRPCRTHPPLTRPPSLNPRFRRAPAQSAHSVHLTPPHPFPGPGERNYHIFGMMFTGLALDHRNMYGLGDISEFRYLPEDNGDPAELKELWVELIEALGSCGFTENEQDEMFSVLAGVLHLGNLDFVDGDEGDAAVIDNVDRIETICRILMVDEQNFKAAMMTAVLNMRGEIITKKNNTAKCISARNATAKALYDKLFQWLVFKVNLTLRSPESESTAYGSSSSIGILDIFGFENFDQNGFDQMCINLANEQLHFFFNQHIFAAELGSYAAEGLELAADTMFHDNKQVLDVFFRRNPPGILGLLDEESRFPKATAASLLNKFNKNLADDDLFNEIKGNYAFGVSHYAGNIVYHTEGFLEKNTDPLPDLVPETCEASRSSLLRLMFAPNWESIRAGNGSREHERGKSFFVKMFTTKKRPKQSRKSRKKSRKDAPDGVGGGGMRRSRGPSMAPGKKADKSANTVSASFRVSLAMLMLRMGSCDPHFVRCIKPNAVKKPKAWEQEMVLRQLTYTGMLQTVKMRREGYPFRIPFAEFFNSYHGTVFEFSTHVKGNAATCTELLERLEAAVEQQRSERGDTTLTSKLSNWKVAKTMVFLKYWQLDLLNSMTHPFEVAAVKIQTCFRRHLAMRRYLPMKEKYADECAMAATLIGDIRNNMDRVWGFEQTIVEEEVRRGPIDLGISKPLPEKELKKAEKAMQKGAGEVNQRKFEKDLNKVKKGVVKWWIKIERSKGFHVDENGLVHPWFHGLISRTEAEDYLFDQPSGAFLIRVSERVHGYALSFRVHGNRIRHYKLGFSAGGG